MPAGQKLKEYAGVAAVVAISPLILIYVGTHKMSRLYDTYTSDEPHNKAIRQERRNRRRNSLSHSDAQDSEFPKESSTARFGFSSWARKPDLNRQLQSRIFSLPAEIRLQIYEEVMIVEPLVHIDSDIRIAKCRDAQCLPRLTYKSQADGFTEEQIALARNHLPCLEGTNYIYRSPYENIWDDSATKKTREDGRNKHGIIALLQSCRRIYTETKPLLYTKNTFITTLDTPFLTFTKSLPQPHLTLIRNLVLFLPSNPDYDPGYKVSMGYSWTPTMRVLSQMPNLHRCLLHVHTGLDMRDHTSDKYKMQDLLSGLKKLPSKDIFVVDWVYDSDVERRINSWGTTVVKELDDKDPFASWMEVFRPAERKKAVQEEERERAARRQRKIAKRDTVDDHLTVPKHKVGRIR
ncbi:unnamed protein product [Periconia digitata]|uniref:DUF7730 domain-containing protein n=1 Tax=Periconia digitata TaxID=1303443 RepID=A0A9W4U329_9PLEO|nr:unnamed protein product [Periconia digitata]